MNWIQVVYIRQSKWKYESMKPILSQKVTEELIGIYELNSTCLFHSERDLTSIFHC